MQSKAAKIQPIRLMEKSAALTPPLPSRQVIDRLGFHRFERKRNRQVGSHGRSGFQPGDFAHESLSVVSEFFDEAARLIVADAVMQSKLRDHIVLVASLVLASVFVLSSAMVRLLHTLNCVGRFSTYPQGQSSISPITLANIDPVRFRRRLDATPQVFLGSTASSASLKLS